jgi:hypothetical protein
VTFSELETELLSLEKKLLICLLIVKDGASVPKEQRYGLAGLARICFFGLKGIYYMFITKRKFSNAIVEKIIRRKAIGGPIIFGSVEVETTRFFFIKEKQRRDVYSLGSETDYFPRLWYFLETGEPILDYGVEDAFAAKLAFELKDKLRDDY